MDRGLTVDDVGRALWRRPWVVGSVTALVLLLGTPYVMTRPKVWKATSVVRVEAQQADAQLVQRTVGDVEPRLLSLRQAMLGGPVLERVVDQLKLSPDLVARRGKEAASPPRPCARPAERSSSVATSSSGADAAAARCHARRSGSNSRSVASASAIPARNAPMIAATPTYVAAKESPRQSIRPRLKNGLARRNFSTSGAIPVIIFEPTSAMRSVKNIAALAVFAKLTMLTVP